MNERVGKNVNEWHTFYWLNGELKRIDDDNDKDDDYGLAEVNKFKK